MQALLDGRFCTFVGLYPFFLMEFASPPVIMVQNCRNGVSTPCRSRFPIKLERSYPMKRHHCLTSLQMALTALTAVVATVSLSRRVTGRAMLLVMPLCALVLTLTPLQGFADYWTTFTSEEYTPIECQPGDLVSGWYCTGSYCDNSYLRCAETHYGLSQRSWTLYISEEGGRGRYVLMMDS